MFVGANEGTGLCLFLGKLACPGECGWRLAMLVFSQLGKVPGAWGLLSTFSPRRVKGVSGGWVLGLRACGCSGG